MIDVLFLSPPRRSDGSDYLFHHATLRLASFVRRNGLKTRIEPLIGSDWRGRLETALTSWKPRWVAVAIGCRWWDNLYAVAEVARLVRKNHPQIKLVTGGPTASFFAEEFVQRTPFDAVITGDPEVPLTRLIQGEPECNLVLRHPTVQRLPQRFVHAGNRQLLVDDLCEIGSSELLGLTAPYVWTNKDCRSACCYCSSRTGFPYRPVADVVHDIRALEPWSGQAVTFELEPGREEYYQQVARELPPKSFHAAFSCWTLPTREFVAQASELFASAVICLDAQTYSEPLRYRLAAHNEIKPFFSDNQLLDTLGSLRQFPNLLGTVRGTLGLQSETPQDVERAESLMAYLLDAYHDVLKSNGVQVTPLVLEPDSLMAHQPERFGMTSLRRCLEDFVAASREQFEPGDGDFESKPHPYGVFQSHEHPVRVHNDWLRIEALLKEKSCRREAEKALTSSA